MSLITLGTKTDAELGFEVIGTGSNVPGIPESVSRTVKIPGRHGLYYFPSDMDAGFFLFRCYLTSAETPEEIQAAYRVISDHLLDGFGRPLELALTFVYEPDKSYLVRYSGRQEIETDPGQRLIFTLPFIAPEPYAFAAEVEYERLLTTSPQNETFEVESGLNVPLTIIIDNEGANTLDGFSFKTYDLIEDWSVE